MKQDLHPYDRAFLMQGLSVSEALDEGLIDFDELFEDKPKLTEEEAEEYQRITEQWEMEVSLIAAQSTNDDTIVF
ncbi:hypothetical protein PCC7424_5645 (plasmid) [Gloeothece citriformis PCC 7424]|uniref:Uncharacterized protein n=1 Tax=Gloeothece citriformis (strain PCC 7424) TaxID=65393 RepID=B7KLP9_GLOC7|nr:hypothetical protein [Gloeothece citriformis]ACK73721.1 hypothetical protein PCC7424_5645 [Gloeothece citriformis PCC 7424]